MSEKQRVYDALKQANITYDVIEHEPVYTMEDMDHLELPEKGTLCKGTGLLQSVPLLLSNIRLVAA